VVKHDDGFDDDCVSIIARKQTVPTKLCASRRRPLKRELSLILSVILFSSLISQ
jgi:hypothetical protein